MASACSTTAGRKPVNIILDPVHKFSSVNKNKTRLSGLKQNEAGVSSLVDNDGNEYWQYWDLRGGDRAEFYATIHKCKFQFSDKTIYYKRKYISELESQQLEPNLFTDYVNCIRESGYHYLSGEGFAPEKFRLTIFKTYTKFGQEIPVGAEFFLIKKDARYRDVHSHVTICKNRVLGIPENGTNEQMTGVKKIMIKPFSESLLSCLTEFEYVFEEISKDESIN
ncbi:MAG: hypothetical protein OEZ39_07735 [Gammaproteobacteria bacterium]|nr:hypothetical protein [Gammaproteobacteria bacterium]MDH5651750.1 hypothetical protein [Gammaproteobacteria bacterium]